MVTTRRKSASGTPAPKTPHFDPNPNPTARTPQASFSTTSIISASVKSVLLHDWWLVKPKGKGLAVGGFASRERLGVRIFSSAAISKRHTATALETADGIMITLSGFLNRSHTHQNGFPSEVYNHYLLGFPFDWEEYAAGILGEDFSDKVASIRNSASQKLNMSSGNNGSISLPFSIDDLPVTRMRDISELNFGDSDYCSIIKSIFSDIQRTSGDNSFGNTGSSINLNIENVESGPSETPTIYKKVKGEDDKDMIAEEYKRSRRRIRYALTRSERVSTRSVTRMKNSGMGSTRSMTRMKNYGMGSTRS